VSWCFISLVKLLFACYSFFFFFSSRRRHTRSKRDWSSDVCSSDLHSDESGSTVYKKRLFRSSVCNWCFAWQWLYDFVPFKFVQRSEERRVGKECRSRWSRYQ